MRQIVILAVLLLAAGGYAARYADDALVHNEQARAQPAAAQPADEPVNYGRTLTLTADRLGHFQVDGRVDGRPIGFMVDTGASVVALRETDAAEVGIRPMLRDYTAVVSTANGQIKAARATIERIEIGDITVNDVPAVVLPDEALATNLLGVSFLSRLKRYEYANGRLVMER